MGQENTVPRRIDKVEGAAGQGIVSQGPGVDEKWGGKLEWTAGTLLQGAGVGAAPTEIAVPVTATKEFFASVHKATTMYPGGASITTAGDEAAMMMLVPQDFTSLISIEVIIEPLATGASMHFNFFTYYGAYNGGENWNVHNETDGNRDIGATVAFQNLAHSISDLVDVAPLATGDLLVVTIAYSSTAIVSNAMIRGIRFKYS